jgi:hypothetical protein
VPVSYVGHPLAELIPMTPDENAAKRALGLPEDANVVTIMPGSRMSEIKYNTVAFVQAARCSGCATARCASSRRWRASGRSSTSAAGGAGGLAGYRDPAAGRPVAHCAAADAVMVAPARHRWKWRCSRSRWSSPTG